ncbi:MAG TPA: oligosaccharide flippase family protein [Sphingomonadaceae bacterium]|nr:oligosaccharide flippase family protein [Sphingomonadaceae bacterium]
MRQAGGTASEPADLASLASGGRTNFYGFLLRLAARIPFLFVAGRYYGAEQLGRFAYAIIIVEFAAQLATLGMKRGLAEQLTIAKRPHVHVVWDGMLAAGIASAVAAAVLIAFPQAMFPNSQINGVERLLPLIVLAIAWSDVALAALAYRGDIAATVRARSVIEPWVISIAAWALFFTLSRRDGLIIAYVLSMVAAMAASVVPMVKSYGWPRGWRPRPGRLLSQARANIPLAAADAIEWGSRRIDIAILGLFFSPAIVGVYYVAQQVTSLPQKLKTSFDPILGPVITRNLAAGNKAAVAAQVRQVGFWILSAQAGVGLALGLTGEAVLGLVGGKFISGTAILGFLLLAEVVAATAAVSESALIYVARHRNLMISVIVFGVQVALSVLFIVVLQQVQVPPAVAERLGLAGGTLPPAWAATGPAIALVLALGLSSILKSRLLARLLGAPVSGWRWALVWAAVAATVVGAGVTRTPEWMELLLGVPLILAVFGYVIWKRGFTEDDRALFRRTQSAASPA